MVVHGFISAPETAGQRADSFGIFGVDIFEMALAQGSDGL